MNKIIKWMGISDLILIVFYLFFHERLNLSSELDSLLISCLIGILFFVLFILIFTSVKNFILRRKKKDKKLNYEATKMIYIFGIVLSIFAMLLSFNFVLYIQALLGNDLFISLNIDKENVFLENGNNFSVSIQSKILTNPFCSASCFLTLRDLSSGNILSYEKFNLFVSNPKSNKYTLFIDESVSGQKLYRVELSCSSEKTIFCYTASNKSKQISKIVSLEHFLNEEQNSSLILFENRINSLNSRYNEFILNLNEINKTINRNSSLDLSSFETRLNFLFSKLENKSVDKFLPLFNQQKYNLLEESLNFSEFEFDLIEEHFSNLTNSFNFTIDSYNSLVSNFSLLRENVSNISYLGLDNSSAFIFNNFVDKFNLAINSFNSRNKISFKEDVFKNINLEFISLSLNSSSNFSPLNITLNNLSSSFIFFNFILDNSSLNFSTPSSVCCLNNNCKDCLGVNSSSKNYPVILLHGHGFNEKVSALGSLDVFTSLQENLERDGYVNAGSLLYTNYGEDFRGVFGKIDSPISIKASYYFDILSTDAGSFLLETKTDNLDTYVIRLKEIINNVKYITGKDKVIVIAHSMGGLVLRRYAQVFGTADLDKMILITVPNHGVDGFVTNYCSFFGTQDECTDMNSNSLFLNKLNRADKIDIPLYNLIGLGCFWENSIGDGIVKNYSAYLSYATNYYVNGSCNGFDYFHNHVLDVEKYPEVYSLINQSLKN